MSGTLKTGGMFITFSEELAGYLIKLDGYEDLNLRAVQMPRHTAVVVLEKNVNEVRDYLNLPFKRYNLGTDQNLRGDAASIQEFEEHVRAALVMQGICKIPIAAHDKKVTMVSNVGAWLTTNSRPSIEDIKSGNFMLSELYYSDMDMTANGWTKVGDAQITLTPFDYKALLANKINALRKQLDVIRFDQPERQPRIQAELDILLSQQDIEH